MRGLSDKQYLTIRKYAISKMKNSKDPQHDANHVLRVKNNALKIIRLLGIEKEIDINLMKATCLLHDFTYTIKRPNIYTYLFEGHVERRLMKKTLDKFDMEKRNMNIIVHAVFHHAHSFPFRRLNKNKGLYTRILQDADTIDYFEKIRVRMYVDKHDRGILKDFRKNLSNKFIEYGKFHLAKFLNFPSLAKDFYVQKNN